MRHRTNLARLHKALILGLLWFSLLSSQAFAEDVVRVDTPEAAEEEAVLPPTRIEGKPEGTRFQDLFARLEELIADEGYTLAAEVAPSHSNLMLSWSISSDETGEAWFSEELLLTDIPEGDKPLEEREMKAIYTVRTAEESEKFRNLDRSLAEAFGIPEAELFASAPEEIENWATLIEIRGTRSTLEYYYTLESHDSIPQDVGDRHTLSAELKPIGYQGESLTEAMPILADYLFERRPGDAEGSEQLFVRALISEKDLDSIGVTFHSVELIPSSYIDTTFVRHYLTFEDDISKENALAVVAYLEEHIPEEITGLQENWEKSAEEQRHISLTEAGWTAGLSALDNAKMMWVMYPLDALDVYR